jgi:ribonuclease BN (tRNA processing enzyme)
VDAYQEFSAGADLLMHDSEFTKEEYKRTESWGHSVYTTALELAIGANVKQFGLVHLNQDRTDDQVDKMVDKCQQIITQRGSGLKCFAVGSDMTFTL